MVRFRFLIHFLLISLVPMASGETLIPSSVNPNTREIGSPHWIQNPEGKDNGRLLIFLGGTNSKPTQLTDFASTASQLGYHVIVLDYPNTVISTKCREFPAPDCNEHFREEIVLGHPVSPHVNVDEPNSILRRIRDVVAYMANQRFDWRVFWQNGDVLWSQTVLAGHSQGSGHAAYLSKLFPLRGVLMIAGPQDSDNGEIADWVHRPGLTPAANYRALIHRDDYFGSAGQKAVVMELIAMGKGKVSADSVDKAIEVTHQSGHADPHNALMESEFAPDWRHLLTF